MKPTIAYFGYGSLVNLGSLQTPYLSAHPATLKGYQRIWLPRPSEPDSMAPDADSNEQLAFLSVVSAPEQEIDGMLIIDEASSLESLDARESLYSRVDINGGDLRVHGDQPGSQQQFLYIADQYPEQQNITDVKILRSYLDVVLQGFLKHFGVDGVRRFYQSTQNFELGIKEDRDDPHYPRATLLSEEEKIIFAEFG